MLINNVNVEFDPKYVEDCIRFDRFILPFYQNLPNIQGDAEFCEKGIVLFNDLFGEETRKKIFGERPEVELVLETVMDFVAGALESKQDINDKVLTNSRMDRFNRIKERMNKNVANT